MLRNFSPRLYQEKIFSSASKYNSLVILPTGLGKTAISLMLAVHRMKMYPDSKVIILAPTKPLVEQHLNYFMDKIKLHDDQFVLFTGQVSPKKRQELWKTARLIFSTPQGLENDIISSRIDLNDASLIVFDEAHRAVGDYSYVFIADRYSKLAKNGKILGLTASPGSDKKKIDEVCDNLMIENVEVKTVEDSDVKPYVQKTDIIWKEVVLPESMIKIQTVLKRMHKDRMDRAKLLGHVSTTFDLTRKQLLGLMLGLQREVSQGEKTIELLKTISLLSEVLKLSHAEELLESQGISALFAYLQKIESEAVSSRVKAVKNIVIDPNFKAAYIYTKQLVDANIEHPKMGALKDIIDQHLGKRMIIFTQFRETGKRINAEINSIEGMKSKLFVGQSKKGGTGLSQKEQIKTLHEFRNGEFNAIVMTSVGEEGLDIPQVELVVFYEPIPSAVRSIQRRGRTGRLDEGKVIVLVAKGTRDEGYRWSAFHKEKRMLKILKEMKLKRAPQEIKRSPTLMDYDSDVSPDTSNLMTKKEEFKIIIDYREKNSLIVKELINQDFKLDLRQLEVGDYILSSRVGVEYKRVPDFVDSIVDGRLLEQIKYLKRSFDRPLIVIEGIEDIYSMRRIDAKAIQGMLATITVSYGIPVIYTKNSKETASIFATITKREQANDSNKEFSKHSGKPLILKEQQEYLVSALPGIGPTLSKPLLKEFKSVFAVLNATEKDLQKVDLIGKKKAEEIRKVLDSEYFAWKKPD